VFLVPLLSRLEEERPLQLLMRRVLAFTQELAVQLASGARAEAEQRLSGRQRLLLANCNYSNDDDAEDEQVAIPEVKPGPKDYTTRIPQSDERRKTSPSTIQGQSGMIGAGGRVYVCNRTRKWSVCRLDPPERPRASHLSL
jgi:hypothetical protein